MTGTDIFPKKIYKLNEKVFKSLIIMEMQMKATNIRITCSSTVKNPVDILIGIALDL